MPGRVAGGAQFIQRAWLGGGGIVSTIRCGHFNAGLENAECAACQKHLKFDASRHSRARPLRPEKDLFEVLHAKKSVRPCRWCGALDAAAGRIELQYKRVKVKAFASILRATPQKNPRITLGRTCASVKRAPFLHFACSLRVARCSPGQEVFERLFPF